MTCTLTERRALWDVHPIEIGPGLGEPDAEDAQVLFVANGSGDGAQHFTLVLGEKQLQVGHPTKSTYSLAVGDKELSCTVAVGVDVVEPTIDDVSCEALAPGAGAVDEYPEVIIEHGSDNMEPGLSWAETADHRFAATFVEGSGSSFELRLDDATSVNAPVGYSTSLKLSTPSTDGRRASLKCSTGFPPFGT
jgi:hypothetical protein